MTNLFITLSIVGFARTLLIILLVYYGVKLVIKLITPFLVRAMQKSMTSHFEKQQPSRREGEVTVEDAGQVRTSSRREEGEYVDFEEID